MLRVILSVALVCVAAFPPALSSYQQTDPFYLRVLEKAEKSFLAKNYWDAAQDFEIAAFGLNQDPTLRAKAYFFIGLCRFYLQNISQSESYMRQGVETLGDRSLASLGMPDSVLPDLEKLLSFFDIQLVPSAPPTEPLSPDKEKTQEKPAESPSETEQRADPSTDKESINISQKDRGNEPPLTLGSLKEGDIVALNLVDQLPVVTRRVPAVYPPSAQAARTEGTVMVNALISEKGSVVKTEIIQGMKGAAGFDQAATQAVRRWKFEPATIKGIKVKVWMPISIVFKKQE